MQIGFVIIGIILVSWAFLSEIYFHYVQKFTPGNVCPSDKKDETFWRAEKAELVNSMFLLIGGITLIIIGYIF